MAAPVLSLIEDGDYLNTIKEKTNDAIKATPVNYFLDNQGNFKITRFDGSFDSIPLQTVFALLGTIFEDLLPGTGTEIEPGTWRKADDENPAHRNSEDRVYTAAGVVRLIESMLVPTTGLKDTLNVDNVGEKGFTLKQALVTDALPYIWLNRIFQGQDTAFLGIVLENDNTASIYFRNQKILNLDLNTLRISVATLISDFFKAKNIGLTEQQETTETEYIGAPVNDLTNGYWVQKRMKVSDFMAKYGNKIDENSDPIFNTVRLKKSEPVTEGQYQYVVRQVVANGLFYDRTISRTQIGIDARSGWDGALLWEVIKPFAQGLNVIEGDARLPSGILCRDTPVIAQNSQTLSVNSIVLGANITHNLQTTEIGVEKVYLYDTSTNRWRKNDELDQFIEVVDATHIRIASDATPGYAGKQVRIFVERMNPL